MESIVSSKKFAAPLHIDISTSRILFVLLLVLHISAILILSVFPFPSYILFSIGFFIFVSALYQIGLHALNMAPKSIVALVWDADDDWFVTLKNGQQFQATLCGDSFINPFCTVLRFKIDNQLFSKSVLLFSDNVNVAVFRRLRVRIKVTNFNEESH